MNNVIVGSNKGSRIFIGTKEMFKVIYHAGSGEVVDPTPDPNPDEPAPEVWYGQFITFGKGYLNSTPETYATGFSDYMWGQVTDGDIMTNGEFTPYTLEDWKKLDKQEYLMTGKTTGYFMAVRKDLLPEGKKLSDFVKIQALGITDYEDPDPNIVEVIKTADGTNDITLAGTKYNFVGDFYNGWLSSEPQRVRFVITTDF